MQNSEKVLGNETFSYYHFHPFLLKELSGKNLKFHLWKMQSVFRPVWRVSLISCTHSHWLCWWGKCRSNPFTHCSPQSKRKFLNVSLGLGEMEETVRKHQCISEMSQSSSVSRKRLQVLLPHVLRAASLETWTGSWYSSKYLESRVWPWWAVRVFSSPKSTGG